MFLSLCSVIEIKTVISCQIININSGFSCIRNVETRMRVGLHSQVNQYSCNQSASKIGSQVKGGGRFLGYLETPWLASTD